MILGIDPSSTRLAFVGIDREGSWEYAKPLVKGEFPARAKSAYDVTDALLGKVATEDDRFAFVEAPIVGMTRNIRTTIAQATTSGGLHVALLNWGFHVTLVAPTSWKKEVVGWGNASKEEVAAAVYDLWPEFYEDHPKDQDLLDAAAIALYGQKVIRRSVGIAAGATN